MGESKAINPWIGFVLGMAGWAIIPAGYFLGQINSSAGAAQALNVTYNIADFVNKIDFDEFLAMLTRKANTDQFEDDMQKAFKVFDKGNRGKIGVNELREIMLGLGEDLSDEQLNMMIKEIDSDGDGYVTFEDFKSVMLSDD